MPVPAGRLSRGTRTRASAPLLPTAMSRRSPRESPRTRGIHDQHSLPSGSGGGAPHVVNGTSIRRRVARVAARTHHQETVTRDGARLTSTPLYCSILPSHAPSHARAAFRAKHEEHIRQLTDENYQLAKRVRELERRVADHQSREREYNDAYQLNRLIEQAKAAKLEALAYSKVGKTELTRNVRRLYQILQTAKVHAQQQNEVIESLRAELARVSAENARLVEQSEIDRRVFAKMVRDDRDAYARKITSIQDQVQESHMKKGKKKKGSTPPKAQASAVAQPGRGGSVNGSTRTDGARPEGGPASVRSAPGSGSRTDVSTPAAPAEDDVGSGGGERASSAGGWVGEHGRVETSASESKAVDPRGTVAGTGGGTRGPTPPLRSADDAAIGARGAGSATSSAAALPGAAHPDGSQTAR